MTDFYSYNLLQMKDSLPEPVAKALTFLEPWIIHPPDNDLNEKEQVQVAIDKILSDIERKKEHTMKMIHKKHHSAKLEIEQVQEIRYLNMVEGRTRSSLATQFGVSYGTIKGIVEGDTWKHLPVDERIKKWINDNFDKHYKHLGLRIR